MSRTRITWHWGDRGALAHARLADAHAALCGHGSEDEPLMRPPFNSVRCEACRALIPAGSTHIFPNRYLDLALSIHS